MSWNIIKPSQKIILGTKSISAEFFVHMSCMTGDTEGSNIPNLHKL